MGMNGELGFQLAIAQNLDGIRSAADEAVRAKQIRRHATHGTAAEFAELTDLPTPLREALDASFRWTSVELVREEASADGETRKALLRLADGHHIETVLMPHHGARNAVCVSTQAGCPMACAFCATGRMAPDSDTSPKNSPAPCLLRTSSLPSTESTTIRTLPESTP